MTSDEPGRRTAEWLQAQIAQRGLSLRRIESETGVAYRTIQKLLAGEPVQRRDRLAALANYLGYRGDAFDMIERGEEPPLLGETPPAEEPRYADSTDYNSRLARMPDHVLQAVNDIIDAEERRRGLS